MAMTLETGAGLPTVLTGGNNDGMSGGFSGWGILLGLLFGRMFGWGGMGGFGGVGEGVAGIDANTWMAQSFGRLENGQQFIRESVSGVNDNLTGQSFALNNSIRDVGANVSNGIGQLGFSLNNSIRDVGSTVQATSCNTNMVLKDGFYGTSRAIDQSTYENSRQLDSLSRQMAECCCQTQRAIDGVQNAITGAVCSIGNMFKDSELREAYAKIGEQGTALSEQRVVSTILQNLQPPRPVPSYVVGNPYTGQTNCFC